MMGKICRRWISLLLAAGVLGTGCMVSAEEPNRRFTHKVACLEGEDGAYRGTVKRVNGVSGLSKEGKAGNIGKGEENDVTFTFSVTESDTYSLSIFGICDADRKVYLSVNGGEGVELAVNSHSWSEAAEIKVQAQLNKGENTMRLYNPDDHAPDLDKIDVYADHPFQLPENGVYISDLEWVNATCGWSGHEVQKDLCVGGSELDLGNIRYPKGLGTHASSEIIYHLNGDYARFSSLAGIAYNRWDFSNPSVNFQVYGDDKLLAETGVMKGKPYTQPKLLDVDVTGVTTLKLVADAGDSNSDDWVNFCNAYLARGGADQTALEAVLDEAKGLEEEDYLPAGWKVLQQALASANNLPQKPAQSAVDGTAAAVRTAIDDLIPAGRLAALEEAIQKADRLEEVLYTSGSWAVMQQKLAAAKKLTVESAQAEIDRAAEELEAAIKAVAAMEGLTAAFEEAEGLREKDYEPDSWAAVKPALDQAVLAARALAAKTDPAAGQTEIDKAAADIHGLIESLVPAENLVPSDDPADYKIKLLTLEGERGEMHGKTDDAGVKAGNIGGSPANYLILRGVAPKAGRYKLGIFAMTAQTRDLFIRVNMQETPIKIREINSGDWFTAKEYEVLVDLQKGENVFKLYNDEANAPDLDKLVIYEEGIPVSDDGAVYLSDLAWISATSGWGGHPVQKDKNADGNTIRLGGADFEKGIGTHANSTITYDLERSYSRFRAVAGLEENRPQKQGEIKVQVYGDDRLLFKSDSLRSSPAYSTPVEIDIDVTDVKILQLVVDDLGNNSGDWASWGDARVLPNTSAAPRLKSLLVNGEEPAGFTPEQEEYDVELPPHTAEAPMVTALPRVEGHTVNIQQADGPEGAAIVTVTGGGESMRYTLRFTVAPVRLGRVELSVDHTLLSPYENPGQYAVASIQAFNNDGTPVDMDKAAVEYKAETLYVSGDSDVVHIDADGRITTVTEPVAADGDHPDRTQVPVGGVARVYARVTVDDVIVASEPVNITVRPYHNHYETSIVGKLGLATRIADSPDLDKPGQATVVAMTFEEALEVIKKIDNLTRGIPKIIYLVGWQFNGHDTGYPDWSVVNPALAREGEEPVDSLIWLMDEALQYNTKVSLHINMTDAKTTSPLWEEYMKKDVIAKNADGSLVSYGFGNTINYTREWELGLAQRRIDQLVEMLDGRLERAGTIHIDAYHSFLPNRPNEPMSPWHAEKYGYGLEEDVETQRRVYRYWRSKGIDVTAEHATTNRTEDRFVGLQPMAWYYEMSDFMNIPASLYCGGDTSSASIFGSNSKLESFAKDKENLSGLLKDFATKSLVFQYLNSFDRLAFENGIAVFADGVVSSGNHIEQDGRLVQDGGDLFVPALWIRDHREIYAYSEKGYTDRQWTLPADWDDVQAVDLYQVTLEGLADVSKAVELADGVLTLSLPADIAYVILPSGTDPVVGVFTLHAESNTISAGDALQLTAWLNGEKISADQLVWQVEGGGKGTSIDAAGLLQVADDEDAQQLTVRAYLADEPGIVASLEIAIVDKDRPEPVVRGDLDKDGRVTIADVMEACKILARKSADIETTADEVARGDLDGDGDVTIADVMEICKLLAVRDK